MKKLTSLKRTKAEMESEKKRWKEGPCATEVYPYGLELRFEEFQIAKLPELQDIPAGKELEATIKVKVESVRSNNVNRNGKSIKERNVTLQVTDIAFEGGDQLDADFDEEAKK